MTSTARAFDGAPSQGSEALHAADRMDIVILRSRPTLRKDRESRPHGNGVELS